VFLGEDGGVSWAYLIVSMVGLAFVVNAYFPIRSGLLTVPSFFGGWLTSEMALQHIAWQVVATLLFAWSGALRAWPGWIGLGLFVLEWGGLVGLQVASARSGELIDRAIDAAHIPGDPGPVDRKETMWTDRRLVLPVPSRGRRFRVANNIDYAGDGIRRHRLDVITRREDPPVAGPVFVYVHGGGWVIGDKREQGRPLLLELARRGWVCVAINYRLSPRATWPDHIVDVKRALSWVQAHIAEYGGDPGFVALGGGSAGGHLSALAALTPGDPAFQPDFEDDDTAVDACLPFYGVHDVSGGGEDRKYAEELRRILEKTVFKVSFAQDPEIFRQASPDYRVTPDAPPFLVVQGLNDTLVPFSEARRFVDALRAASHSPVVSVELPCAQHAFDVFPSLRVAHVVAGSIRFLEGIRHSTPRAGSTPHESPPA
jgi:acetyl esterase/lipase